MKSRSKFMTVVAAAAAAWAVAVSPASAASAETDVTESSTGGTALTFSACRVSSYGQGCFAPNGDWFSVEDGKADGHSAVVYWELYKKDSAGNFTVLTRWGTIWNTRGNGTIGYQNKTFPDGLKVKFQLCVGEYADLAVDANTCTSMVTTAS
ncbi:hypothetical protein HEP84_34065 [Streptomyces sp. RLB1-33]|nr:hypothetical protein [Streptomyces sp. RLB1-33]QIY73423.1 hypothetical protein HEP84_34065 [Streptomyces sp. RLB1-33]